jgi:hypothetical protein
LNIRIPFRQTDHATDSGEGQLCKDVLSVIVIILPSEKNLPNYWKLSQTPEKRRLDRSWYIPLRK